MAMNLGELKALLAGLERLPDDTPVILQKDSEGNGYSPLSGGEPAWYIADSTYSGEVYLMPQDEDEDGDEDEDEDGDEDEDDDQIDPDDAVPAVVLWPVN